MGLGFRQSVAGTRAQRTWSTSARDSEQNDAESRDQRAPSRTSLRQQTIVGPWPTIMDGHGGSLAEGVLAGHHTKRGNPPSDWGGNVGRDRPLPNRNRDHILP